MDTTTNTLFGCFCCCCCWNIVVRLILFCSSFVGRAYVFYMYINVVKIVASLNYFTKIQTLVTGKKKSDFFVYF